MITKLYHLFFARRGFFLMLTFFSSQLFSQSQAFDGSSSLDKVVEITDSIYGINSCLVNGKMYSIKDPYAKGHPFFHEKNDWVKGTLYINGSLFTNVSLKYDIEVDEVIFIDHSRVESSITIKLNKDLIDSVQFDDALFINSIKLDIQNPIGFIEPLYVNSKIPTYIKYEKELVVRFSNSKKVAKYDEIKTTIYFRINDRLVSVDNEKDLYKYYTAYKKDIITYMKLNNIRFKRASKFELFNLFKYCNETSTTSRKDM